MEYLTLHDMPHRHMYHARRMATPDELRTSERTLPALPTVCASTSPFPCESPPPSTLCSSPLSSYPPLDGVSTTLSSPTRSRFPSLPRPRTPKTESLRLPLPYRPSVPKCDTELAAMVPADFLEPSASTAVSSSSAPPPSHRIDTPLPYAQEEPSKQSIDPHDAYAMHPFKGTRRENERVDSVITFCNSPRRLTLPPVQFNGKNNHINEKPLQNHLTRNSPPFQPNEQPSNNVGLPSFQQLLKNVNSGEPSPPRTPNRSNGSTDSSPVGFGTQWEEVAWGRDGKRRRLDSADSQYRPSYPAETLDYEPRHSVAIDPALTGAYGPPLQHPSAHHHRPSVQYPPHSTTLTAHMRHQSSPVPQGHVQYQHHAAPAHHSISGPSGYPAHPSHYERRPSYFTEGQAPAPVHAYERAHSQNPYYPPASAFVPHGPYGAHVPPQSYASYTFQSALGVDQSSFNRKRRGNLPKEATSILKKWFQDHRESPYPTEEEKIELCQRCSLTLNQVSNWFINARRRAPGREQRDSRDTAESSG